MTLGPDHVTKEKVRNLRGVIYVYPFSFFRELAKKREDVLVKDSGHNTALHWAAGHNRLDLVKYLVEEHGADVNVKTKSLATPLHFAAASKCYCNPVVDFLILKEALHFAAACHCSQVVEYLILKGAKINEKDEQGDAPLQIACRYKFHFQNTGLN